MADFLKTHKFINKVQFRITIAGVRDVVGPERGVLPVHGRPRLPLQGV